MEWYSDIGLIVINILCRENVKYYSVKNFPGGGKIEICSPYLLFISVGLGSFMYLLYKMYKKNFMLNQKRKRLLKQNLTNEYYSLLQSQMDLTRRMRHDIDNHMQILEELLKCNQNEVAVSYATSLRGKYECLQRMNYCQDIVVDSVIFNKVKICDRENIRTDIQMNLFEKGNITDIEILELLSNLFDNAIEGCRQVEEKQRFIELSGRMVAGHIVLRMCNSMRSVVMKHGQLLTNKKDKEMHGIGMRIIEDFVKRNNGTMDIVAENGVFEVKISVEAL